MSYNRRLAIANEINNRQMLSEMVNRSQKDDHNQRDDHHQKDLENNKIKNIYFVNIKNE